MLQFAYYSVISPEGCAGILWKVATDETKPRAAGALRLTAIDLKRHGVIDDLITEPPGGAHRDPRGAATTVKNYISRQIRELQSLSGTALLDARYSKFRRMGEIS
jgi:acetyl-CoA carboxylase carboxyl transferase subunit alpha